MIWLTWRQHRLEAAGAALLLAVVAAILLATGIPSHTAYARDGLAACLAVADVADGGDDACGDLVGQFIDRYYDPTINLLIPWFYLLPALAGVFAGAPLLARELEHGTWQLAWTQAVPRRRWLTVKLGLLLAGVVTAAVAFTMLYAWWRAPFDRVGGRFNGDAFDFAAPVFTAYAVFAFAVGVVAGALIRRIVAAMAATLGGFVAVRVPVGVVLRPRYLPAQTIQFAPDSGDHPAAAAGDWILAQGYAEAGGRRFSELEERGLLRAARDARVGLVDYAHEHGLLRWMTYHPADRYWDFQLIETALFGLLAVALLTVAAWLVRRRLL